MHKGFTRSVRIIEPLERLSCTAIELWYLEEMVELYPSFMEVQLNLVGVGNWNG